jgi:hypothetical protein
MSKFIYESPDEIVIEVAKHLEGQHDQSTHGSWASGQELETWDPHSPIPDSPRNAGGMTERVWEAWEHGPDGDVFVELFRKYACQQLGLPVPKTPYDPGGYMAYTLERGWGAPNRNEVSKMLEAIANSKPQPTLYRGLAKPTFKDDNSSDGELFDKFMSMKPGDQFDMPVASTTRSLGVAAWYAADRVSGSSENVIIKIQEGAKGVARKAENSWYPQDYEVITSGKFEVVSINKVKAPYWSRGYREARKLQLIDDGTRYEVVGGKDQIHGDEAKKIYDVFASKDYKSLETPTFKFTDDRINNDARTPRLSAWEKQPEREFTVVEVKMVEPHTVQKSTDFGNEFFNMFNAAPFIRDNEPVEKHGTHDQSSHGNWAHGGMGAGVADSILARVRENGGLSVNMVDGSEPTTGYMVAKGAKYGAIVDAADFYDSVKGPKALADYMKKHKAELGGGKNYLGLWHNTEDGKVYLDVSENIQDRERAISAGRKQDQISIWDVANFAEIQTGGTGNVEKTGNSSTSDQYLRNDGRGNRSIRSGDLAEVSKTLKVIRFAPGLKPVIKHLEGQHDQSTHGRWAKAGYTEDQQRRMKEFQDVGPSYADILNAIQNGNGEQAGYQDLVDFVNNDEGLYEAAIDGIEERVAAYMEAYPNANYDQVFENEQNKMIEEYINQDDGSIAQAWEDQNGQPADVEELIPFFEEVYNFEHTGNNLDGVEHTVRSEVQYTDITEEGALSVRGGLFDENNNQIGEFGREFYIDNDGNLAVEHKLLAFYDDGSREEFAGTGFGKEYILNQEAWLTQAGIDNITVMTGWDGARHWARAGYDWDERNLPGSLGEIIHRADLLAHNDLGFKPGSPERQELDKIMSRAVTGYTPAPTTDVGNNRSSFPIPAEIANIGYTPGARDWAGKDLLQNLNVYYKKHLQSAEGQSILQGPIDRDGDGMVYDGTPREKPAPSK